MLSDDDPCSLATLAQERVELGAAHGDRATVGQGHHAADRFNRGYKVAFCSQIHFTSDAISCMP